MRTLHQGHKLIVSLPAVTIALAALSAAPSFAQTKSGTAFGSFLLIEPSARVAGMGNAGVSLFGGLQATYYNPAALGSAERYEVAFSHSAWLADINYDYAAVAIPVGKVGTFSAVAAVLNSGDIDVRTVAQPLGTGERFTVSNIALGLGYGRHFTHRFAAGLQLNYVEERIWNSSARAFTMNIGTLYRLSTDGLRIGASISNLGTNAQFSGRDLANTVDQDPDRFGDNNALPAGISTGEYPVPILFRVGVSKPFRVGREFKANLAVDGFHPNNNAESMSMGGELSYRNRLAVRAGYQNLFLDDSEVGLTLGAGLNVGISRTVLQLDYAWADHGRLEGSHRFTIDLEF
jgi:hypothetical protein